MRSTAVQLPPVFYQVLASQVRALMMALYRYFQREASLPNPSGPLSESVSLASIRDANVAVQSIIKRPNKPTNPSKSRGTYRKIEPEKQAAIAKYASKHGNKAAATHFSKQLGLDIDKVQFPCRRAN